MNDLTPYEYRIYARNGDCSYCLPMSSGINTYKELAKLFYSWEIWNGYEIYKIETIGYKISFGKPKPIKKLKRKYYEQH